MESLAMNTILESMRKFWMVLFLLFLAACSGSGADSSSGGSGTAGPLEGCWASTALGTTWCFTGTTSEIRTASNNGIAATQISGLSQMTFTSTSMTYYITRAAVQYSDGTYLYDNATNDGPHTQSYSLNSSGTAFTAGNGTYTKTSGGSTGGGGTTPTPTPTPTTGQIAVWTSRTSTTGGYISVTIDGASAGTITTYFTSTPSCGSSGTVTKTVTSGSHTVYAKDGGTLSWPTTSYSVTAGGCTTVQLQ
jgi:hypothetical protein